MQRRTNQAIFAILAMLTIWIVIHTSRINNIDSDVTVLNRTSNSMMNRLIELESKETDEMSYYDIYEEQNRYLKSFESDLTFKETFKKMRAEYGAGHIFDWNERLFTTYYAEELMLTKIAKEGSNR
tara:strand:+ start:640 stop:1017 length:378 start_codon:yes stop_codon:yes gene_type:complete